jgi:hypothetical protein
MGLTRVFALMTVESIARLLTDRTRVSAKELRVISQAHRVNTSDTMKGRFELREPLTISPAHMLAGVLERVAESSGKTCTLKLKRPTVSPIRLRSLDINTPSAVFILSNTHPCIEKLLVWNVRANVNAMGMKIRVVLFLLCVPTAKLVAPKK